MSALEKGKKLNKKKNQLIDSVYTKMMKGVIRSIGTTDFYEFFMDSLSRAENEIQFSNRRMEKIIDLRWIEAIEASLESMQHIVASPRNVIREDEIIVNVAHAKKGGSDVVRHLAQHGALVEDFNEETGEVRPSKLMQKLREDSEELYENRLAFTSIEMAYHFVESRYSALFASISDEFGAKLKTSTKLETATEMIHFETFMQIQEKDSALEADEKNGNLLARIDRLHRLLTSFIQSPYGQQMSRLNRVKGNVIKTNVLKKNPYYRKLTDLYDFLRHYDDVGYAIKITEQNPYVSEELIQNVFHNTMFQYLVLKGYLEDERDRQVPQPLKQKKRTLKPKIIKDIIEELTEDYDVHDLEVRKILIEELTKEQLMLEEESERLRLVEEQAKRKEESEEYRELLMEHEKEKLRLEHEAELERQRLEEEERKRQKRVEELELLREDERRKAIFMSELTFFNSKMMVQMDKREEIHEFSDELEVIQDYLFEAKKIEDEEMKERFEEELRLQKIEDEHRKVIYSAELMNFSQHLHELLKYRTDEPEVDELSEQICDYLLEAKVIEDAENAERERLERIEQERLLEIERQKREEEETAERIRLEEEKEAERIRVLKVLEQKKQDDDAVMSMKVELYSFMTSLSLNRSQRAHYNQHWHELTDHHTDSEVNANKRRRRFFA